VPALLAAFGASAGYAVATILQALGTRRSTGLRALAQPLVLLGLALDGASFLLSLVAYARLPLFLVQTVIAASVAFVVVLAVPLLKVSLRRRDVVAVVAVVAGLVGLALIGSDQPPATPPPGFTAAMLAGLAVLAVALGLGYRSGPAWLFGTISALGYAGVAIAARGARTSGSWSELVAQPLTIAVVGFGVIAFTAYVRALDVGPVTLAASLVAVIEVAVPGVAGLFLFGDNVPADASLPGALAVLVALAGCVVLGSSPATAAAGD
jgi:drug/metabolite transporter (DMT)-like permease